MNLAFYVDVLSDSEENNKIFNCLNQGVEENKISDASIFFNNIGRVSTKLKFGLFNSTDIWNYNGILITNSVENVAFASRIINKFKLAFMYSGHNNLFKLIDVINNFPVFTSSKEYNKELHRITGKIVKNIDSLDINSILEVTKNAR